MPPKTTPETLRADAQAATRAAHKIWHAHDAAGGEHSAEELARFDGEMARANDLLAQASTMEAREKALNDLDAAGGATGGRYGNPMPHNDARNTHGGRLGYSLIKAMRQADTSNKEERLDGIELETHQELVKRRHAGGHAAKGILVPWDLEVDSRTSSAFRSRSGIERRDLTTTTGSGAVINATLPTMIELLRNLSVMNRLGARIMADMIGNFSIPRQSAASTTYWINPESGTITKSNQTIGAVAFTPKTIGAQTVYSREFLYQTSVDAEMFVREDHARTLAVGLDAAGLAGTGSGAQPTGILYDAGVNVVASGTNGLAPTWALIAKLEKVVDSSNALDGSLNFVTSPAGRFTLKTTVKDSNTAAKYLWNEDFNTVNGYPAFSTNQIPSNLTKGSGTGLTAAIFGDFYQALYAFWGGTDLIVNPYTNSNSGAVEVTTLQDADFHLRHSDAFGVNKDMIPS